MAGDVLANLKPVPKAGDMLLDGPATGAVIQKAREALHVSQKLLASEMHISQSYLCDLEQGRRDWTLTRFNEAKAALAEAARA